VAHRHLAEPLEQLLAGRSEGRPLDAAVVGLAPAADEALCLERVQVVRQRGAGDAHRLRHPGLIAPTAAADEQQDLPGGGRAAGVGERALEGLGDGASGAGETEAERRERGRRVHGAILSGSLDV
jgi:hypothetical protein